MRLSIVLVLVLVLGARADQFVYVRAGRVQSAPRELPSAGLRLDNGQAVLGLHARDDATRAACGWFRVVPSARATPQGQVVTGRSYTIGKATVQEALTFGTRITITPEQRIAAVLASMPAATDDERVSALVRAVAVAVTGTLDKAVTITVPARTLEVER
jgi:hypothetical protein